MTQYSWPWQGQAPGDGADAGPYTAAQWWQRIVAFLQVGGMVYPSAGSPIKTETARDNLGVAPNIGNEMEVTNPANQDVQIDTGAAIVEGEAYYNTAAVTLTLPLPSGDTRVDYIVIRKNYTAVEYDPANDAGDEEVPAYTARITRIVGTEGAGTPALTQSTDRTTYWDIPLATVSITTGGAVTVTDMREWAPAWAPENLIVADEAWQLRLEDAVTAAITTIAKIAHYTSGVAADGFGAGLEFVLENDNGDYETAVDIIAKWIDASDGTEDAALVFRALGGGNDNEMAVFTPGIGGPATDGNARGVSSVDLQATRSAAAEVASGNYSSITGGQNNTASGAISHAEGDGTTASGAAAHSEGDGTEASGDDSHAEGEDTVASGNQSHAEGNSTTASGQASHAEGFNATASKEGEHAFASDVSNSQGRRFTLEGTETHDDDTWRTLYISDDGAAAATKMTLAEDTAWVVNVQIIGQKSPVGKTIGFELGGVVENPSGGNVNIVQQSLIGTWDTEDSDFDAQLAVDTGDDELLVQVRDSTSGSDSIRWAAVVRAVEVTYISP
jgi:hypothetical protein